MQTDGYKERYANLKRRDKEEAERLFSENLKLVKYTIRKLYGFGSDKDEDKWQSGCLGLWLACIFYDSEKGAAFSSYATRCIFNQLVRDNPWDDKSAQPSCYLSENAHFQSAGNDFEPPTIGELLIDQKSQKAFEEVDFRDFLQRLTADEQTIAGALIRGEPVYKLQKSIGKTWWWGKQQKEGIKRKLEGVV